jgi:flagellar biosynthesis chaperone FliJ
VDATAEFDAAREKLDAQKQITSSHLQRLGQIRLAVESNHMQRFVTAVRRVNHVSYRQLDNSPVQVDVTLPDLAEVEQSSYRAADLLKDGVSAVSAGLLTGIGAGGLATQIGVASTGTAISSLSGVAATNATLAWLGGGSLASGGMGMAGGMAVLGGAIAGPLLAVAGYTAAKRSEVALTEAYAQASEIAKATEQIDNGTALLEQIASRTQEIGETIERVAFRFEQVLVEAESMLARKQSELEALRSDADRRRQQYLTMNIFKKFWLWLTRKTPDSAVPDPFDFNGFSDHDKETYTTLLAIGYGLYALLKVKVLDESGAMTPECAEAVDNGKQLVDM